MHRSLFLDDEHVARLDGVVRKPHRPTRFAGNPLLTAQRPWERARLQLYGRSVLFNAELGRFQMFYMAQPNQRHWPNVSVGGQRKVGWVTLPALAESSDGVNWERVDGLGVSFEDVAETNLLDLHEGTSFEPGLLYDPGDPDPERRLKALVWDQHFDLPVDGEVRFEKLADGKRKILIDADGAVAYEQAYNDWGMRVAFSRDGRSWQKRPGWVLPCYSDTGQSPLFDPQLDRYVAFGRFNLATLAGGEQFYAGRGVSRIESKDFEQWSGPEYVLGADHQDPEDFQINSMPVDLYEGRYVGLLETDIRRQDGHHERLGMQLAVSSDGRQWQRVADRFVFVGPPEDPSAWDQAAPTDWIRPASGLLTVAGQVRFYYNAGPLDNSCYGIGMAYWRQDGFVSLTADRAGGELLTRTFVVDGAKLHLNLDATDGEATVEICDLQGRSLAADAPRRWSADATAPSGWSQRITGDHLDTVVRWPDANDLDALRGRPVALRIRLQHAQLYSFWTA
jgi:hypothetical protein